MAMGAGVRKDGVYQAPGQHEYDGMICLPTFIPRELDRIKHELQLNDKDVVSASYPRTGEVDSRFKMTLPVIHHLTTLDILLTKS